MFDSLEFAKTLQSVMTSAETIRIKYARKSGHYASDMTVKDGVPIEPNLQSCH